MWPKGPSVIDIICSEFRTWGMTADLGTISILEASLPVALWWGFLLPCLGATSHRWARRRCVLPLKCHLPGIININQSRQYITSNRSQTWYLVKRLYFPTKVFSPLKKSIFLEKNVSLSSEKLKYFFICLPRSSNILTLTRFQFCFNAWKNNSLWSS